jgi:hypothetical protein
MQQIKKIQLPTRPQVDTLITFFIISKFGKEMFQGFDTAELVINPLVPEGETFETLIEKGTLCIDVGNGPFDHHNTNEKSSAEKALKYFDQEKNTALTKLLELALRSEQGKGTLSQDALDKMFGFDGIVMTLNKVMQSDPRKVIETMQPIISAYYDEAYKRSVVYPETLDEYIKNGKANILILELGGKKWKTCVIETADSGFIGFLRAYSGGKNELVAQVLPSGHVNILTRMNNGVRLMKLAYLLRHSELILRGDKHDVSMEKLMSAQRIEEVPEWYYDTVTNSILNGGVHPASVKATLLKRIQVEKLLQKWQDIY